MNQIRKRITYANVMSSIAVFLVLGGGAAFAATKLAKNSVGTKQLKRNAVTAAKIKKNSITGAKIKNGAVTGPKIVLSTLGTVPSATNALNAMNATNAANAAHATTAGSNEQFKTWFTTASIGQTVTLLTIGPFTYTGECASGPEATSYVETSQENSVANSYEGEDANPFNPGEAIEIGEYTSGNEWYGPDDGSDAQLSGDGHTFVNTFVSNGSEVGGADCTFVGYAFTLNH